MNFPDFPEIRMGLPDKELNDFNCTSMRLAITEGCRESALIHNCLMAGKHNCLSGEDTYTLLAYSALIELERFYQLHLRTLSLMPLQPPMLIAADSAKQT